MSGYAATARLQGASVHAGATLAAVQEPREPLDMTRSVLDTMADELLAPPETLEDRIHYVRQAWAQTTFFLFDPDSWR